MSIFVNLFPPMQCKLLSTLFPPCSVVTGKGWRQGVAVARTGEPVNRRQHLLVGRPGPGPVVTMMSVGRLVKRLRGRRRMLSRWAGHREGACPSVAGGRRRGHVAGERQRRCFQLPELEGDGGVDRGRQRDAATLLLVTAGKDGGVARAS